MLCALAYHYGLYLHIKAAVKNSCRIDYKEILQRKKCVGSENLNLFYQPVGSFDAGRFAIPSTRRSHAPKATIIGK